MRVLWIIDSLGPGGAERLMLPLLKNLDRNMIESRVCVLRVRAGNPVATELAKMEVPVDMVRMRNLRNPFNLWRLIQYIHRYKPDIIHTQLETSDILGTLAAHLLHVPSISTVHTLDKPVRRKRKPLRNFLRRIFLNRYASRIVAVSDVTRLHYIGLGYKKEKLQTIYNGINLNAFERKTISPGVKADLFGFPCEGQILTTVAVLREQKGIQHMLQALPQLLDRVSGLNYVIVGDGDYRQPLEALSASLGITGHVHFMGHRTNIPEILSASDLFVFPTLSDALPTVLFEAMAAGVPIVASEVGGVPEILVNDVNGLLVPPADPERLAEACHRLLRDRQLENRLAVAAHATVVERFNVRHQVKNLLALYDQVVAEHGN